MTSHSSTTVPPTAAGAGSGDIPPALDLLIRRIHHITRSSQTVRHALYFRLLRITQYLAWKFPAYGALQSLLEEVLQSKAQIGKQTQTVALLGGTYDSATDLGFSEAWNSRFLFTYRKNFAKAILNKEKTESFTTDQGWGCYIRVFQMMLAQCYSNVVFGEEYRSDPKDHAREREFVKELFVDSEDALFSVIFDEIHGSPSKYNFARTIKLCVFDELFDPDVVLQKLSSQTAVLCLYSRRFGPNANVSPEYCEAVKQENQAQKAFRLRAFQGLASGDTATSAHYFVAASEFHAYYLDPHVETRPALDGAEMDVSHWHAVKKSSGEPMLLKLDFGMMNSSCCFGFLIRDQADLAELCMEVKINDALMDAIEIKRDGFLENLVGGLDHNKWDEDEDGNVLL